MRLMLSWRRLSKLAGFPCADIWLATLRDGAVALFLFSLAALCYPVPYNPMMRMLSALGRTEVRMVSRPWSHYLFVAGMAVSALAVARIWMCLVRARIAGRRGRLLAWGAAANVAGLCVIALVPENESMVFHTLGCHLAALGGAGALLALDKPGRSRAWTCLLLAIVSVFCALLLLHAAGAIPFAPWVPSVQKLLIASFAAWIASLAWSMRPVPPRSARKARGVAAAVAVMAAILAFVRFATLPGKLPPPVRATAIEELARVPFSAEEEAALRWLEHVAGPLSGEGEKEWWDIGGTQHGLLAKRYSMAFCGYAAAALGARGDDGVRKRAGRILGWCVERYLKRETWAYSMSRNYWGRKPWAPDPCYRENVMYTGHLLQLLALYEMFTGDARYWTKGFDFVWNPAKQIHYDVGKLIDATVLQMRKGPNGGIACEPGLMFFPCNNHPHIALAIFGNLGHGDWRKDALRWEKWALPRYMNPLFGGGALNLVYHVRSGIFYPRGHGGLDGWSLLWYEPWASSRGQALALWRAAAQRIDWSALEAEPDVRKGEFSCCDPVDAPPVATASLLAAAARACDDPATADRLDAILRRHLVHRDGMAFLDVGRDWRIGATANWIISLAEANGMRFRKLLGR